MLIAIAIFCTICEMVFTALEVAIGAVTRARMRSLMETERDTEREAAREQKRASEDEGEASPPAVTTLTAATASGSSHKSTSTLSETNSRSASQAGRRSRARRLLNLLDNADRLILSFIIVTAVSLWTAVSLLTWEALRDDWPVWWLALALVGVLFFAEVVPVLIAARNPEAVALGGVGLAETSLRVLHPLIVVLGGAGRFVAQVMGAAPGSRPRVTEGELRTALAAAEEEGVIESEERALLEGAMEFREKVVREVMTPRLDMVAIPAEAALEDVLRLMMEKGHSRLPVYEGTPDKIVGIVSAKDLIPALRAARRMVRDGTVDTALPTARDVARPPFFVPESKRIAATLDELRVQRSLVAIVVDDDGGTAGLVTLEDLLEELVGEIQDEYDQEEPEMQVVEGVLHAVLAEGGVTLRECERFWQRNFDERITFCLASGEAADASRSLAALALQLFDGIPAIGDRVRAGVVVDRDLLDAPDITGGTHDVVEETVELVVQEMEGPRIALVRIEKADEREDAEEE